MKTWKDLMREASHADFIRGRTVYGEARLQLPPHISSQLPDDYGEFLHPFNRNRNSLGWFHNKDIIEMSDESYAKLQILLSNYPVPLLTAWVLKHCKDKPWQK